MACWRREAGSASRPLEIESEQGGRGYLRFQWEELVWRILPPLMEDNYRHERTCPVIQLLSLDNTMGQSDGNHRF